MTEIRDTVGKLGLESGLTIKVTDQLYVEGPTGGQGGDQGASWSYDQGAGKQQNVSNAVISTQLYVLTHNFESVQTGHAQFTASE